MKVYNVKAEAKMQFHFPIVARNSAEAERIVHELCGVNGAEADDELSLFLGILMWTLHESYTKDHFAPLGARSSAFQKDHQFP